MSSATTLTTDAPSADATHGGLTTGRVLRSEWIKLRTVRSSRLTLVAAAAIMVIGGAILGYATSVSDWNSLEDGLRAPSGAMAGYVLAQLVIGVFGVLFVTSEYSTGMIRSTFAAVPRRLPVMAAKSAVVGAVALIVMTLAGGLAFLSAQAFLSADGHGTSLTDADALRAVAGIGAYLTFVGVLGVALGWIFRSSASAIGVLVALLLVAPSILQLLPESVSDSITPYLPTNAGQALWSESSEMVDLLSPLSGGLALLAWLLVMQAVAAAVLLRRDA